MGETSRNRPDGREFAVWTSSVRRSLPTAPFESVERTATARVPTGSAVVTCAPAPSSKAPSPSRSHAWVTPSAGLAAARTTTVPARGAAGWTRIDGEGAGAWSRAGAIDGNAATKATSAAATAIRPQT